MYKYGHWWQRNVLSLWRFCWDLVVLFFKIRSRVAHAGLYDAELIGMLHPTWTFLFGKYLNL